VRHMLAGPPAPRELPAARPLAAFGFPFLAWASDAIPFRTYAVAESTGINDNKGARLTLSSGTIPVDLKWWWHSMACARLYAWARFQVPYQTSKAVSPLSGSLLAGE